MIVIGCLFGEVFVPERNENRQEDAAYESNKRSMAKLNAIW
jgi:hypothetical protein